MKRIKLKLIPTLILIFYADTIFWLFTFWLAEIRNVYGLVIFSGAIYLLWKNFKSSKNSISINKSIILLFPLVLEIINKIYFHINIFSAILFITSLVLILKVIFNLNFKNNIKSFILLFLSLPIQFYINTIFGYLLRKTYAIIISSTLYLLSSDIVLIDTTIQKSNLYINIDSGCSGTLSMYLITVYILFLTQYKRVNFKKSMFIILISLILYFLLNLIHLLTMTYAHNFMNILNIRSSHEIIASLVTLITLLFSTFLIYKNAKKSN